VRLLATTFFLGLMVAAGCAAKPRGGGCSPVSATTDTGGSLPNGPKFVGNITTRGSVRAGFNTYWDQLTPENEGKWGWVQRSQGSFNWASLDNTYAYAQANGITFKQHTFVWGKQQPSWVTPSNAATAVQDWMKAFCERYPDTRMIDVVNEPPPHTTPSYVEGLGGAGVSGWDWIVNAFTWARAACPNAILILNDYGIVEDCADNAHIIAIVKTLQAAGAPIDAVGSQSHGAFSVPTTTVQGYIDRITRETGLPVYITEYDIPEADDSKQLAIMQDQMTMFLNNGNVKGVTLWGYIVGMTWMNNTGIQQPSGEMRPAMTWLMTTLGRSIN
jgi:endo-1,4-beta-xylanase